MTDAKLLKSWKITETLLEPARHALPDPSEQHKQEFTTLLAHHHEFLEHNELGLALDALEELRIYSAKERDAEAPP